MSVLDELRSVEDRVTSRLNELRPLVEEYRELERAARRLGIDPEKSRSGRAAARRTPARSTSKPSANGRRRSSAKSTTRRRTSSSGPRRRDQVLALVQQRPGITVPELGTELKVDPTGLYRVVRGLESEGAVKKEGKALRPA
jgi:hypothetical protein